MKVRVKSDHTGVDISNFKISMNRFDEIAKNDRPELTAARIFSVADDGLAADLFVAVPELVAAR